MRILNVGNCSQCLFGRLHKPCQVKCDQTLLCGHSCPDVCAKNCPPCQKKCDNKCAHGICKKKCREPCIPCTKPCNWKCQHLKCTKLCSEPCDRPRCDKPCKRKPFKKCRHRCIGMCGEPCPKKCRVCDKEEVTQNLFGNEGNQSARFVEVQPCGHVIEVKAMDKWVDDSAKASSKNLQFIRWEIYKLVACSHFQRKCKPNDLTNDKFVLDVMKDCKILVPSTVPGSLFPHFKYL